jgi:hypothetical protein
MVELNAYRAPSLMSYVYDDTARRIAKVGSIVVMTI